MKTQWLSLVVFLLVVSGPARADLRYEGDVDPVTVQFWGQDGTGGSHSVSNGILTVRDTSTTSRYLLVMGDDLDRTRGWTAVFRARTDPSAPFTEDGRVLFVADGTYREALLLGVGGDLNRARLRYKDSPVVVHIDTTQFHTYRITRSGNTVTLYIDENPTPVDSGNSDNSSDRHDVRIGSEGGTGTGTVHIDFVHVWSTGAYAPGQEPELSPLLNQGFDAFYGSDPSKVATGWQMWGPDPAGTYTSESNLVWTRSNRTSQRLFEPNKLLDGGLRQRVAVTNGRGYTFGCHFRYYFSPAAPSPVFYQVGVDPTGTTNDANVVWSSPVQGGDQWQPVTREFTAAADYATVYIRAYLPPNAPYPNANERSIFFDDASLVGAPICQNDIDSDEVCDEQEHPNTNVPAGGTNRILNDSDGDGLLDGVEDRNRNGVRDAGETSARNADSDGDRFGDALDPNPLTADAGYTDADNDGLHDPNDPDPTRKDTDGDRYDDGFEASFFRNVAAASNATQKPTLGDANGDSFLTSLDALVVQSYFLQIINHNAAVFDGPVYQDAFRFMDANRDGFVTSLDALVIQSFFLQILATLPLR